MAGPFIYDLVKETTTTTGTGTVDLAGAVTGFRTFVATVGTGNTCFYAIRHRTADEWEIGIGTVTDAATDTLSRDTVLASSNAGALVSFSAGTKDVFNELPAAMFPTPVSAGSVLFGGSNGVISQDNNGLFWDATNDFLGLGTNAPSQRLHLNAGNVRFDHVTNPGACAAALAGAGAGNVDNGTHAYKVTLVTAAGETAGGTGVTVTVVNKTANGQVSLTGIPTGTAGVVTSRKVYRTKAGGGPFYLLTTLGDNTTTTYTDNTADGSLPTTLMPAFNGSAGHVFTTANDNHVFAGGGSLYGPVNDKNGLVRNVRAYGALGGAAARTNGSMTAASATLTSTGLAASDVGKLCAVSWAGANQVANPTTQATAAATGGGSTGGGLQAGNYRVAYAWQTAYGETTVGTSESAQFTVAAGNIPRITIPSLPANATGAKIYLTAAGGASGSETVYATGVTATTADLTTPTRTDRDSVPTANTTAAPLVALITGFTSSTQVTLDTAATVSVSNANILFGWDDTQAFQDAIDVGSGTVVVPAANYIVSQLRLKNNVWLRGTGWGSQIYQRPGHSGHLVVADAASTLHLGVYDLALNGARSLQTSANDAVSITDATSVGDEIHTVYNVFITDFRGNGIYLGNQVREVRIAGCYAVYCDGVGLFLDANATDNTIVQSDFGHCGTAGVKLAGATNRLAGVKSFWAGDLLSSSGHGFHITGDNNELSGCEAQDCLGHGWMLDGCDRTAISNGTSNNNSGDAFRFDAATDCKLQGQVLDYNRATHTSVCNFVNSALRNQAWVAFTAAAITSGNSYVQGTVTGNDVHVGPDGGFQAPSFPGTATLNNTVDTGTETITTTAAHGLSVGDPVFFVNSGGALPGGLAAQTAYWVKTVPTTTTLTLAPTSALGSTVNLTGNGTGTNTLQKPLTPTPYSGNYHKLTLTADMGVSNPAQQHQGQRLSFQFTQDATGGRKIAWGSAYSVRKWTANTGASKANTIDFIYDGSSWVQLGGTNDGFGAPGILYKNVSPTTFNTSSAENTLDSFSVQADLLGSDGAVRVVMAGDLLSNSGTTNTYTFRIKFGATTLWGDACAAFSSASATRIPWRLEFTIQNTAAATQVMDGMLMIGPQAAAATSGEGDVALVAKVANPIYGTSAIDTTAAATVLVSCQMSTSNVAAEVSRKRTMAELLA